MKIRASDVLGTARIAVADAARRSDMRRLTMYPDSVPCRSGCDGCCSRLVTVSVAEAVLMYEHLKTSGDWPRARAACVEQAPSARGATPVAWFKMNIKCPVLKENRSCGAHPVRPIACSTHFVQSEPAACDPWAKAPGPYKPLDFRDVAIEETSRLLESLEPYGVLQMQLPLPLALLLAERVSVQSGLSLEQVISYLFNEL